MTPLALRLPNPPPVFVGRDAEVERLGVLTRRGRVVVVSGEVGRGRRALVAAARRRHLAAQAEVVRVVAGAETLLADVAGGLSEVRGTPVAATIVSVLAAADALAGWVVVECEAPDDLGWALAVEAAAYSARATWLFVTVAPAPEALVEYALAVGPLSVGALETLWSEWAGATDPAVRAVAIAAADGSPARLRRLTRDLTVARWRQACADPGMRLLAAAGCAVPTACVQALDFDNDVLAGWRALGLVVGDGDGLSVKAEVRAGVPRQLPIALVTALVGWLPINAEADLREAVIRLALEHGLEDHAYRLLAVERAVTLELARVVVASVSEPLTGWRVRAATLLGEPARVVREPAPADLRDRLLWAEGLAQSGEIAASLDAISATVATAEAGPIVRDEGRLLAARFLGTHGHLADAVAQLDAIASVDVRGRAAGLRVRLLMLAGRVADSDACMRELVGPSGPVEGAPLAPDVALALAAAAHDAGRVTACLRWLDQATTASALAPARLRRIDLVRIACAIDQGEVDAVDAQLRRLEAEIPAAAIQRQFVTLLRASWALVQGDAAMTAHVTAGLAAQAGYVGAWAGTLYARARMRLPRLPALAPHHASGTYWDHAQQRHQARALAGQGPGGALPAVLAGERVLEVQLAEALMRSTSAVVSADGTGRAFAAAAMAAAVAAGHVGWQLEAAVAQAEAALAADDDADAARATAQAAELARRLGADGWRRDFRVLEAVLADAPGWLEPIAVGDDRAAARARWLLGDDTAGDAFDRAVLRGRRWGLVNDAPIQPWALGWGIDLVRERVWSRQGVYVEFATRPTLWRILQALVDAPAGLSKGVLVEAVWQVSYHPLHHDKRLQNAVHKLRLLLDEASGASCIVTLDDGYRLDGPSGLRLRRVSGLPLDDA